MKKKNTVLRWLWNDLISKNIRSLFTNALINVMSIGAQLGAFALLFKFVSILEKQEPWTLFNQKYGPEPSQGLLISVSLMTGLLFISSGVFKYYAKIGALKLSRRYEEFCSSRLLDAIANCKNLLQLFQIKSNNVNEKSIKRSMVKDTRSCGKVVLLINQAVIVLGKLSVSIFFMLYVNFLLSILIVLLFLPMLWFFRKESKKVVALTRKRESLITKFIANRRKVLISAINKPESPGAEIDHNEDNAFYNVYYKILRKLALTDMAMTLFIALLAICIIIIAGNLVLFGSMNWSVFIAYMIALRFFFVSLQGVGGIIKKSSRIYEYVAHYISLLSSLKQVNIEYLPEYAQEKIVATKSQYMDDDDDDDDDDDF